MPTHYTGADIFNAVCAPLLYCEEMALIDQIQKDILEAMRAKDAPRLSILRMVKNALKNKEIALKQLPSEEESMKVLLALAKQSREAADAFRRGGRSDLADKEVQEGKVIQAYLPESVSEDEIVQVVAAVVEELAVNSLRQMGEVMKEVLVRLHATGKIVDGRAVNAVVRDKLSG